MKRVLLILACLALMGVFFVSQIRLAAQDDSYTIDFDGGYSDYSIYGSYGSIGGNGNPGNALNGTRNGTIMAAQIQVNIPSYCISGVYSLTYQFRAKNNRSTHNVSYFDWLGPGEQQKNGTSDYPGVADDTWRNISRIGYASNTATSVNVYMAWAAAVSSDHLYIDNIVFTCGNLPEGTNPPPDTQTPTPTATPLPSVTDWNSPIRAIERADVPHRGSSTFSEILNIAYEGINTATIAFSNNYSTPVFAVHAGSITSVHSAYDCSEGIYSSLTGGHCLFRWDGDGGSNWSYWNRNSGLYYVDQDIGGGYTLRYLVDSPAVTEGVTLEAGCLIGKTWAADSAEIAISVNIPPSLGVGIQTVPLGVGVVIIQALISENTSDITLNLVTEPSGAVCSTNNPACPLVANPGFGGNSGAGLTGWERDSTHPEIPATDLGNSELTFEHGLPFPNTIQQTLNLDSAVQYTITVVYHVANGYSTQYVNVALGTTSYELVLSPSTEAQTTVLALAYYTPDQDAGLYSLRVWGDYGNARNAWVYYICVSDLGSNPQEPGGGCLVHDPNFNINPDDSPWFLSTDPAAYISTLSGFGSGGFAVVPDAGFIYDTVTLNPKDGGAQQDYILTVTARRAGVAEVGESVSVVWDFEGQTGSLGPSAEQIWQDYTATISVSTDPIDGTLYLTGDGSDTDQKVQISQVCIRPADGGTSPGYRPPPVFDTTTGCRFCVYSPTGDVATDISEFQQWLACQFFQLWECQAKILLRYIWQALVNILTLFGFFRLWLSATIIGLVNWGGANMLVFARWGDSELQNLGIRFSNALTSTISVTNIISGGGTTLGDIILALIQGLLNLGQQIISGIVTPIIALLQQIITGLLDLARLVILLLSTFITVLTGGILGILTNIFGLLLGMFQSILNGFSAAASTVVVPEWIPNCADPNNGLFVVCTAIYGVEQTLNTGPMVLIMPVGIGLASFSLILWGLNKIRGSLA